MSNPIKKSVAYGAHTLTLETGEIARQAGGAVMVSLGDTVVLVTAVAAKQAKPGQDFFPLTVDYQEKTYAAGKHPRRLLQARRAPIRKGDADLPPDRSSDPAAVSRRLLQRHPGHRDRDVGRSRDRSRHPRDASARRQRCRCRAYRSTVRSAPRGSATRTASTSSTRSKTELETSQLNLVVAGTEAAVLMVESEAQELPEDVMLGAVVFGHQQQQAIDRAHSPAGRGRRQADVGLAGARQGPGADRPVSLRSPKPTCVPRTRRVPSSSASSI